MKRILVALFVASLGIARTAHAADAEATACAKASEEGQDKRDASKLVEAREKFLVCGRPTCPAIIQRDCAQWLSEVMSSLPSLVFGAKDAHGQDLLDVKVTEGARVLTEKLGGSAVYVDPGPHTFRLESSGSTVEQKVIVREGEKNRQVTVTFGSPSSDKPAPPPPLTPPPAEEKPGTSGRTVTGLVVGGVGIVALGVGTYFGIHALGKRSDSDRECPNDNCSAAGVSLNDDAITAAWISNIAIGVGVIGVGVGAYLLLTGHAPSKTALRVLPSASPNSAGLRLSTSF